MPKKKKTRLPPPGPPAHPERRRRAASPPPEEVVGEVVPPTQGPPAPVQNAVTWVDWYNKKATPEEQVWFDRAASVLDNCGTACQKGGSQENYIENWRDRGPDFFAALVNYRDTGGRAALFATPAKDYGPRPISVVMQGGPIEPAGAGMLMLHPGKYTYSDVTSYGPGFQKWLAIVRNKTVAFGQMQVSQSVTPFGSPYYTDYEFLVTQDTLWPPAVNGDKLVGTPTWIPKSINIVTYWGQVTQLKPDWLAPVRGLEAAGEIAKGLVTLVTFVAVGVAIHAIWPSDRH